MIVALNNHIQDVLDGIDAIHTLEEQIGESHAISEQMRAVTMKAIEMFNSGIDEIITKAQDAQTELREAQEIYADDFTAYRVCAAHAAKLVEDIALTEKIRPGIRISNNQEQPNASERGKE